MGLISRVSSRTYRSVHNKKMTDLLKPDIYSIKGRNYCLFNNVKNQKSQSNTYAPYIEDSDDDIDYSNHESDDFDIIEEKGLYKIELLTSIDLFKFIIGRKGETINKIKKDCNLKDIHLGSPGSKNKDRNNQSKSRDPNFEKSDLEYSEEKVVIKGTDKKLVIRAASRVQMICHEKRHIIPYSHYVCIPLDTPQIQKLKEDLKMKINNLVSPED